MATELSSMDATLAKEAIAQLILNGELLFFNASGEPVDVVGTEPSFAQLVPGSDFLERLNFEADTHHPQFIYRTIAGNERGVDYQVFAQLIGVFADDGIVEVESANSAVVGQVQTATVPYNHTEVVEEQAAQLVILQQIGLL